MRLEEMMVGMPQHEIEFMRVITQMPNQLRTGETDTMTDEAFLRIATLELGLEDEARGLTRSQLLPRIAARLALQVRVCGFYLSAIDDAISALTRMGFDVEPYGLVPIEKRGDS